MLLFQSLRNISIPFIISSIPLLLWGCHEVQLPAAVSPSMGETTESLGKKDQGTKNDRGSKSVLPVSSLNGEASECVGHYTKFINKNKGGELQNCHYGYEIPPKAMQQSMEMHITILNDGHFISADFGPSQSFSKPVLIKIPYDNADLSGLELKNLTIAWYDEYSGEWIDVGGTVDQKERVVYAHVDHFTRYTLSAE